MPNPHLKMSGSVEVNLPDDGPAADFVRSVTNMVDAATPFIPALLSDAARWLHAAAGEAQGAINED